MALGEEGDENDPVCGVGAGKGVDFRAFRKGLLWEYDWLDQAVVGGRLLKRLGGIREETASRSLKSWNTLPLPPLLEFSYLMMNLKQGQGFITPTNCTAFQLYPKCGSNPSTL